MTTETYPTPIAPAAEPAIATTERPLTDAELPLYLPQHSNREPASRTNPKRYSLFESDSIVSALEQSGLVVRDAIVQKSRGGRRPRLAADGTTVIPPVLATQTRHLYRMCRKEDFGKPEIPEFVVVNSHDGSCSLTVYEGFFRLICSNGMIVGGKEDMRIRHAGHGMDEVLQRLRCEVEGFKTIYSKVDAFKCVTLSDPEIREFAVRANAIRVAEHLRPLADPMDIVAPRRSEDVGNTLWKVFNVAQENLIKGGLPMSRDGLPEGAAHKRSRAIVGIGQNLGVNRRLWALAERFATHDIEDAIVVP